MTTIEQAAYAAVLKRSENDFYNLNLPPRMWGGIERYLAHGIPPGHFLTAILEGDLFESCSRADDENISMLSQYARFLYNCVPGGCYGSKQKVEAWIKGGGYAGGKGR
jgi:hypothetical protein